ncbi:MAG: hypothetical protein SFV15_11510 [Polyangiaceae bacterium]|nr:hypothetical protein [Polyangiaceae bacterium]
MSQLPACTQVVNAPVAHTPAPAEPEVRDPLSDPEAHFSLRSAPSGEYQVALPDARGWRLRAHTGPWFALAHPATRSELWLRTWRASRLATLEDCFMEVHSMASQVPELDQPGAALQLEEVSLPTGFRGALSLAEAERQGSVFARARLVAVKPGQCFVGVYLTEEQGAGALRKVFERLTVMADHTLRTVRFSTIDERARSTSTR